MTRSSATVAALLLVPAALVAQDRLKTMPGYEAAQRVARDVPIAIAGAVTNVAWPDARAFEYDQGGKHFRWDIARNHAAEIDQRSDDGRPGGRRRGATAAAPDRGRQFESAASPDGRLVAVYRDRNVWIGQADGSERARDHHRRQRQQPRSSTARASWVYGEEFEPAHRDVVVARQPQARVLPLRRARRRATTTSR